MFATLSLGVIFLKILSSFGRFGRGNSVRAYALCKVIFEQKIAYGDLNAHMTHESIQVLKLHTHQSHIDLNKSQLVIHQNNGQSTTYTLSDFITASELNSILHDIQ